MREEMFEAELLHEQLGHVEQQLEQLGQQHREVTELISALNEFEEVKPGTETLMSVAPGIFARGTLLASDELLVNVGKETFVKKSPEDVRESLQEQLQQMEAYEKELRDTFEKILASLNEKKERFKE